MLELLHPFVIALLIGFIIGLEREHSQSHPTQIIGVRTFTLIALLGTFAAWFNQPILAGIISLFVVVIIILSYIRSTSSEQSKQYIGITTEVAACIVFCLGYLAYYQPILASIIGSVVLLMLAGRKRLHYFSKKQLKPREIQAATIILILAAGIIPLLPNQTIDPWHLFNPYRFAWLVLLIALLQFGGYVAIRVFGESMGLLLTGFFGGLISSIVVIANISDIAKAHAKFKVILCAAAILATVGSIVVVLITVFAAAPKLLSAIGWPLFIMVLVGTGIALLMISKNGIHEITETRKKHQNPLQIKAIINLAIILGGMLALVAIAQRMFGSHGVIFIAFFAGLVDLRSITLAIATLFFANQLTMQEAELALMSAVIASIVIKFFILGLIARNRFALVTSVLLSIMLSSGLIVAYMIP
jgi:uncharacterized membrane protein (DUF4010 family)